MPAISAPGVIVPPAGLGTFTANVTNDTTGDGVGQVTWNFSVNDSALDYLGAGDVVTQTYTVTVNDGASGTVSRAVVITITGSNDAPIITAHDDGAVESIDASAGNLTDSGTVSFADVDLSDVHTASVTFVSSTFGPQLGSLTAGPSVDADTTGSGSSGSVAWNFAVANSAVHALAYGQTVTETYAISISDGQGGTATQLINVAMTDNEPPTVSISDGTPNPATEGTDPTISFTVSLSAIADEPTIVTYSTVNGSAVAGADFTGATGLTVTIPAGATTAIITIPVLNDAIFETPEAFTVHLSAARLDTSNEPLAITDADGTGNIIDDQAEPTVSISDGTPNPATEGTDPPSASPSACRRSPTSPPLSPTAPSTAAPWPAPTSPAPPA